MFQSVNYAADPSIVTPARSDYLSLIHVHFGSSVLTSALKGVLYIFELHTKALQ